MPMQVFTRSLLIAATALCGARTAHAQTAPQLLAQNCATLSTPQIVLATGSAVAAGSSLLIGVAADSNAVAEISISDAAQSHYVGVGAYQDPASKLALVLLRAPLERALPNGSQINVNFGNAGSNAVACAQVFAAKGVAFSGQVTDTAASASSVNAPGNPTIHGAGNTAAVPELVLAVVASDQSAGTAATPATANVLSSLCSGDICIAGASYLNSGGGTSSIGLSGGTQTKWLATIGALYDDDIFGNGFN
jgi:hypothetical protein